MHQDWLPAIVIIAYNRAHSLSRILGSLLQAQYPEGVQVPLVISIDKGDNADVLSVAESYTWPYGTKEVIYQSENLGLKAHVLACGDLTEQYGAAIVLEDDLYVSPYFYQYARQGLAFYADQPGIAGISLYTHRANVHANNLPFIPIQDGNDVFFMQMPSSWGQVWTRAWWRPFRTWLETHGEIAPEERISDFVRSWPPSSWLKHKIRYLVDRDLYYVYPRISLATNFGDSGTNFVMNSTVYQVPILRGPMSWRLVSLSEAYARYDSFFEWDRKQLARWMPDLAGETVEFDCYGRKNHAQYDAQQWMVVASDTPLPQAAQAFGLDLRPFEMNLVERISGQVLFLIRRQDLPATVSAQRVLQQYYYEQIPLGTAGQLTQKQLKNKFAHYLRRI
ncbi:MAG: glycosyl transferase family 2 [Bacteroidetes bacterium]|nr:MAG: glycosyl transferase family 2 [Bacteroidota bacterium]